jgi:hypothetical protein
MYHLVLQQKYSEIWKLSTGCVAFIPESSVLRGSAGITFKPTNVKMFKKPVIASDVCCLYIEIIN